MPISKHATAVRITEAAAQLFARQGFHGTSTREIARLADVNEATLFRYFENKEGLFWKAVECELAAVRVRKELKTALEGDRQPDAVLPMVLEFLVQIALYQPQLMRLLYFSMMELEVGAELLYRKQLHPAFDLFQQYVNRCIGRKQIRQCDPVMVCTGMVSSVLVNQTLHRLLTGNALPYKNSGETISAYSKFWMSALLESEDATEAKPAYRREGASKSAASSRN